MSSQQQTHEKPVIATGSRGAQYTEVWPTSNDAYVIVTNTRGARYAVQADSVSRAVAA